MRTSKDIKPDYLTALRSIDDRMARWGFQRPPSSTTYKRLTTAGYQTILFQPAYNPSYSLGDEVHINPTLRVYIGEVTTHTRELVKENPGLIDDTNIVFAMPIANTAPNSQQTRWFASGLIEMQSCLDKIANFIAQWSIPVLDLMQDANGLVKFYDNNEREIVIQQHTYIYVAGAALAIGNEEKAREVMLTRFGSPGMRKRYSVVFEKMGI